LTLPEYINFKDIHLAKKDQHLLDSYFRDYIREGGLPENVLQPSRDYLMNLVDDIIQKDITAFHGLKDHQMIRDYFTLLMERSGKQASINKISNILKISPDTSRRYLKYFEETYLIHLLPRWGKTNERILSAQKNAPILVSIIYTKPARRAAKLYRDSAQTRHHLDDRLTIGGAEVGIQFDQLIPGLKRADPVVEIVEQYDAPVEAGHLMRRIFSHGSVEGLNSLSELPDPAVHDSHIGPHIRIPRIDLQSTPVGINSLEVPVTVKVGIAQLRPNRLVIRVPGGSPLKFLNVFFPWRCFLEQGPRRTNGILRTRCARSKATNKSTHHVSYQESGNNRGDQCA